MIGANKRIEERRRSLLASAQEVTNPFGNEGHDTLGAVTRRCSMPPARCALLTLLARTAPMGDMLELGSNVGISGAYLASVLKERGVGCLHTVEGVPHLAAAAERTVRLLDLGAHMHVTTSSFDDALEYLSGPYAFVLLDGEHVPEPTVRYTQLLRTRLLPGAVVVIDDCSKATGVDKAFAEISGWGCWDKVETDGRFGVLTFG